jgi:O-antigen ligase
MAKRRQVSNRTKSKPETSAAAAAYSKTHWTVLLVSVCFFARWFVPTEATAQGQTLWLAGGTFLSVAWYCWWQSRQIRVVRIRFGVLDATIGVLALAHVISCLLVLTSSGQKRFALTLLWEWSAVAIQFFALQQVLADRLNRKTIQNAMLAILIALSGYGIYQHWIEHPAQVKQYLETRRDLDEIPTVNRTAEQDRKFRELTAALLNQQVPLDGRASELFLRRLRDSTEPYGFFALANTYGGFVALLVVLLLVQLVSAAGVDSNTKQFQFNVWVRSHWPWVLACLAALYCLLLTKSRSAFLAAIAGTVVFGLQQLRARTSDQRRKTVLLSIAAVIVVALVMIVVAFSTGSLDAEVFTEAPKSLRYRIQYWTGTVNVIQQHPWFGVGPGNFRGHYLKHKLPEASEEIADPHQYVLDVFVNSGVLGLAAVLFLTWLFVRSLWKPHKSTTNEPVNEDRARTSSALMIAVTVALVFAWQWTIEARTNMSLLAVGSVASLIGAILDRRESRVPPATQHSDVLFGASAAAVLLTHLLVAGGIAYPAVNLSLFVLIAFAIVPRESMDEPTESKPANSTTGAAEKRFRRRSNAWQSFAVGCFVFGVSCLIIGLGPVLRSQTAVQFGDYVLTTQNNMAAARSEYLAAAKADPWSPQPHLSLAQLSFRSSNKGRVEKYFSEAVGHALDAAARNPNSRIALHFVAKWYSIRFQFSSDANDAKEAVRWYAQVLEGYPTQPTWNAEYALALAAAGQKTAAQKQARHTLVLEQINQAAQHSDRFLAAELLQDIQILANPGEDKSTD